MNTSWKIVCMAALTACAGGFAASAVSGQSVETLKRHLELTEVNFPDNPSASANILITKKTYPEGHPNDWEFNGIHTKWDIAVSGLHCTGNHQQPEGHAEWTRQASYGLYVNGLRLLTFNEGCPPNGFGDYKTVIHVFVPLPFNPFYDDLVAEVVPENDDGFDTCGPSFPCNAALLRGTDEVAP